MVQILLVCNSYSPKQKGVGCCGEKGADGLISLLEEEISKREVNGVMVVKASPCMKNCAKGMNVKSLKRGILYQNIEGEDADALIQSEIEGKTQDSLGGKAVVLDLF